MQKGGSLARLSFYLTVCPLRCTAWNNMDDEWRPTLKIAWTAKNKMKKMMKPPSSTISLQSTTLIASIQSM